ncbi:flagellin [Chromatiaceae bacterium AAb-1]|nr:flagellin [Chromatiaceae bacterium AAb-1]
MALSIQSNAASNSIQNQLNRTNNHLATALERLGSGFRVNSAKDDAAGLQIATRLNAQARGQEAAIYNINNANAMLQTAEGAFEEMTNIAYRIKELSTQGANGTNNASTWASINKEVEALTAELTSIMANTTYGADTNLFDATNGKFSATVTFQIGANIAETLDVDVSTELGDIDTAIAAFAAITDEGTAQDAMTNVDEVLAAIGSARASFGATMNRLDHTANNVNNMLENTKASVSQILDADFAKETSNMTKQQLLLNSGISVLTAANSSTQMIGSLLR